MSTFSTPSGSETSSTLPLTRVTTERHKKANSVTQICNLAHYKLTPRALGVRPTVPSWARHLPWSMRFAFTIFSAYSTILEHSICKQTKPTCLMFTWTADRHPPQKAQSGKIWTPSFRTVACVTVLNSLPHPYNLLGPSFSSKHWKDSSPTANVQDHLVLEEVPVVVHCIAVGQRPNLIFEHLLQKPENTQSDSVRNLITEDGDTLLHTNREPQKWCSQYSPISSGDPCAVPRAPPTHFIINFNLW